MSDYTPITDFSAKDALTTGDPEKIILGADIDGEFTAIQTAIATKYDSDDLASQAQAQAETANTVLMTPLRVANWADANAGIVGDLQAKTDPNADQLLGWDDSAGAAIGFTLTAPLAFNNTAIEISGLTASVSELNVLDGITASTAELNILDGVTLTTSQINDAARKTAANTFTSKNTFTQAASGANGLEFNSALPGFWLVESDASADNQDWRVSVDGGVLRVALSNGARNSVADVFQIARNGNTATEIQLDATTFDFNGALDLSGAATVGGQITSTASGGGTGSALRVVAGSPFVNWYETDGGADEKNWDVGVVGETFRMRSLTDADGSATSFFVATRGTGVAIASVELAATAINLTGAVTAGNTLTVTTGGAAITGNSSVTGTFSVSGTLTVGGAVTLNNTAISVPSGTTITTGGGTLTINGTGETLATFADDGAVTLYHDNTARLATSSSGVSVTGSVTASNGLTVSASGASITGNSTITGTLGVTSNATVGGTLGVTGATTLTGAVTAATIANSTSTTLAAGQLHFITGNATLPNLGAGQWIQVINDSASPITISKNASDTTYWATTGATVSTSFTLAARGVLTARCNPAGNAVYVSGSGITGAS